MLWYRLKFCVKEGERETERERERERETKRERERQREGQKKLFWKSYNTKVYWDFFAVVLQKFESQGMINLNFIGQFPKNESIPHHSRKKGKIWIHSDIWYII